MHKNIQKRLFVEGLKGKIWIRTNEDKGITVFFTQPISD